MTIMKLELKAIKHTVWASEETHCYQASLYVNGKPVAIVSNDGRGGCDRDYDHPKFKGDYHTMMKSISEYFKSLPNEPSDWSEDGFPQRLEYWCAEQVNRFVSEKDLKRKFKSYVLFQIKGKDGIYQTKFHPTVTKGEWITSKHKGETRRILNDLPFDEALTVWRAS
tara:strand:- start:115 stop:615 length:501 start_codon:yes stop_codon:yes gene_type:complete